MAPPLPTLNSSDRRRTTRPGPDFANSTFVTNVTVLDGRRHTTYSFPSNPPRATSSTKKHQRTRVPAFAFKVSLMALTTSSKAISFFLRLASSNFTVCCSNQRSVASQSWGSNRAGGFEAAAQKTPTSALRRTHPQRQQPQRRHDHHPRRPSSEHDDSFPPPPPSATPASSPPPGRDVNPNLPSPIDASAAALRATNNRGSLGEGSLVLARGLLLTF